MRTFDGRPIDAELHVEQYTSEVQGVGGFLVLRDVSLELGALGRLVDQLGGALFRVRVADTAVEAVSPSVSKLTGVGAATVLGAPRGAHRPGLGRGAERLLFLYRRLARGEMSVASAQISVRRSDGTVRLLHVRATGRRDGSGVVRHIEGVVNEADGSSDLTARPSEGPPGHDGARHDGARPKGLATNPPPRSGSTPSRAPPWPSPTSCCARARRSSTASSRELRGLRGAVKGSAAQLPPEVALDLTTRMEAAAEIVSGAAAINRGVRRVLATATTLGAPLSELLDKVQRRPRAGARRRGARPLRRRRRRRPRDRLRPRRRGGRRPDLPLPARLPLRRVRLPPHRRPPRRRARRGAGAPETPGARGPGAPVALRPGAGPYALIEIAATAPPDLADQVVETSSDVLRAIPRPAEADAAYQAAVTVLGTIGGSVESDDATFATARTIIRLRV